MLQQQNLCYNSVPALMEASKTVKSDLFLERQVLYIPVGVCMHVILVLLSLETQQNLQMAERVGSKGDACLLL